EIFFYHVTGTSSVNINIPSHEWSKLTKEDQTCLTFYAESLVQAVKAEPRKFTDAWIRYAGWSENQASDAVNGISNLCDDCWCVVYGKVVRGNNKYDLIEDDRVCGSAAKAFRGK